MVILKVLISGSSFLKAKSLSLVAGVNLRCETEIAAQQESKKKVSDPYLIEVVQELLADQGEALQILSFGGLSLLASLSSEGCLGD